METLWQDLRFALRTLRKNLSVTLLATGSLALAIAGNTTVYSLVNSFLYRPIPYERVDRLVLIGERNSDLLKGQLTTLSAANYLDYAARQNSFQQMAAYQGAAFALDSGGEQPEQLTAGLVTPGFFALTGVEPVWGRPFLPQEGQPGHDRVVLLSHTFWREHYGEQTDLSAETLKLNGERYAVVGLIGEDFEWMLAPNTDVWVPLALEPATASRQSRNTFALARLAEGVDQETAAAEIGTLMAQLTAEYPDANRGYTVELLNMREDIPDTRNRLFFRLLQAALIFVLLIACANIANLLLSRSQAREREIAIRTSIGASRRRITVQLFTESMVMASVAGIIGMALGFAGMKVITNALGAFLPSFWIPTLDLRVLTYSLAVTLLGGLLFGLAPVLQTSRFDLLSALKDSTQGSTTNSKRRLAANSLVVLEIAFALAFLAGASMMISSFKTMQSAEAGFDTDNILIMRLGLPAARYDTAAEQVDGVRQVMDRFRALPGVRGVAVSNLTPRTPFIPQETFEIPGQPSADEQALPNVGWLATAPGYFETLGIPLRQGRGFTADDDLDAPQVAVINEAMAKRFWGDTNPLGTYFTIQGEKRQVVGIAATVRHGVLVRTDLEPFAYLPWAQRPDDAFSVALTTEVEPGSLSETVRRDLLAFDPNIALTQVQTLDAFVEQFWVGQRIFTALLSAFGALALVLAALGTYGVLAYSVAQRTHEIGIRMAIGADRGGVMRMITRQGLTLGVIGIVVGIPLVLVQVKVIAAIFADFVPVEPTSVIGVAVVLAAVTALASALPARRAASVDPIEALRAD